MAAVQNAIATGVTVGLSSGNPLAGIVAGGISLFAGISSENATNEYNDQLAAIASLNEDRQKAAATIQKLINEKQHDMDVFTAERSRKSFVFKETLAQSGISNFAAQTGTSGSSIELTSRGRITLERARGTQDSIRSELLAEDLFNLQQKRLDVLAGMSDSTLDNIISGTPTDRPDSLERPQPSGGVEVSRPVLDNIIQNGNVITVEDPPIPAGSGPIITTEDPAPTAGTGSFGNVFTDPTPTTSSSSSGLVSANRPILDLFSRR